MTLNDLIRKAQLKAFQFTSGSIPLVDQEYNEIEDIDFDLGSDEDGMYIQMIVK